MSDNKRPQVGRAAPAFALPAVPEGTVRLSQFKGKKNVILYFYPRDNTPGCTQEACDFRDTLAALHRGDAVVLGVSTDSVASHQKFADKFELPFPLLSDETHEVCEKYGVWVEKKNYGKAYMGIQRATFLIDKRGRVAAVWPKVKVAGHVAEVAQKLAALSD
jgi:peroxiredoxin Q/BCP